MTNTPVCIRSRSLAGPHSRYELATTESTSHVARCQQSMSKLTVARAAARLPRALESAHFSWTRRRRCPELIANLRTGGHPAGTRAYTCTSDNVLHRFDHERSSTLRGTSEIGTGRRRTGWVPLDVIPIVVAVLSSPVWGGPICRAMGICDTASPTAPASGASPV